MQFTYGSICSGIEAASVAWHGLGKPLWFSEIEPYPCAVLAHRFPNVPNLGDMTALPEKIRRREIPTPDVLVGGTPCQAFSVAGKRESLNDERGNLTLVLIDILDAIDEIRKTDGKAACILVWENVPGVLNTQDNAFGCFLGGLCGDALPLQPAGEKWTNCGCVFSDRREIAWRVLDAQFFGVAQRRKRVFLVASAGKRSVAQILIERKGVRGDIAASRAAEQNATAFIETGFAQYRQSTTGGTVRASGGALSGGSETLVVHGTQDPVVSDKAYCLGRNNGQENVVAIDGCILSRPPHQGGNGRGYSEEGVSYTLTRSDVHAVSTATTVRKLTPRECERLQGFPDDWTKIPYRNKPAENCPDSLRYKAIGNSMAVPCMRWIGERLSDYLFAEGKAI